MMKAEQLVALVDALETQLAAANLLSALVAELTGIAPFGNASSLLSNKTGRRGRLPIA